MSGKALFACSKCFSRHPFDELSTGQQLCKECRGVFPVVKCTYCRTEFQQENKNSTATVCKKCDSMVKQYGKPSSCEYCNVIAAFIGSKCQRCANNERKYGMPKICEQCKQKCAFDRKEDDRKKVNGKLLCWLCTVSYKRAIQKTKATHPARHTHVKLSNRPSPQKEKEKKSHKRPERPDITKSADEEHPAKVPRLSLPMDNDSSSDQLATITQLRDQISRLEKQLTQKQNLLINKEKEMHQIKATQYTAETELREKMRKIQREHDTRVDIMQKKMKDLNKELVNLKKSTKRKSKGDRLETIVTSSANASGTDGGGSSGTESPSVS